MTDPLHTEPVVTQAMRDCLAFILRDTFPNTTGAGDAVEAGQADGDRRMQAIARLCTAAEAAFCAREARLREALERIAGKHGPYSHPFPEGGEGYAAWAVMEARAALTKRANK